MLFSRNCKTCNKKFSAIKITNQFCCRKCFKKDYYVRTKVLLKEKALHPVYPQKKCGFCNNIVSLDFDPIKKPHLFDSWECPKCGVSNQLLYKYQEEPNSYQMIASLLTQKFSFPIPQVIPTQFSVPFFQIKQEQEPGIIVVASTKHSPSTKFTFHGSINLKTKK